MSSLHSWDELLQRSQQQLQEFAGPDTQYPLLQRNVPQLEVQSRQLKAKAARLGTGGEPAAAISLLAQAGINADQLTRDLRSFQLKTTFEDVFPVDASSVEEYLSQVHEMSLLAALQVAQRSTVSSAADYMLRFTKEDWQREKSDIFRMLSHMVPASQDVYSSRAQVAASESMKTALPLSPTMSGEISARAVAYARAVRKINQAQEQYAALEVATCLKDAYSSSKPEGTAKHAVSMLKIWSLIQAMLGKNVALKVQGWARHKVLLHGALCHLEEGHARHMLDIIQAHASVAALGGSTGNLQRVRAFLRVRLRDQGTLDFDIDSSTRQPVVDTTWSQIYYCIRSGYYKEACQVAQESRSSQTFAPQLAEWVAGHGGVTAETSASLALECERSARAGPSGNPHQQLLLTLLCGGKQHAQQLFRQHHQLFSTIQDFMWFRIALLQNTESEATGLMALKELQEYLLKFGSSYYSKNGKDPLVYPYVLLLSLQLQAAVHHLVCELSGEDHHLNGVHLAIALGVSGVLDEFTSSSQGAMKGANEGASLVQQYGRSLLQRGDIASALEYYEAASCMLTVNEGQQLREELLKELLQLPAGADLLLANGTLSRFLPHPEDQRHLILAAAHQCCHIGHYDEAVELLKRAGAHGTALSLVVRRMSEAVAMVAAGTPGGYERCSTLLAMGAQVAEHQHSCGSSSASESQQAAEEQVVLRRLGTMVQFYRYMQAGRSSEAIQELRSLPWLPMDGRSSQTCVEALRFVPRAVEDRLPHLLEACLSCLRQLPSQDASVIHLHSQIVNIIASSVERNWPQDVYMRVANMHASPLR